MLLFSFCRFQPIIQQQSVHPRLSTKLTIDSPLVQRLLENEELQSRLRHLGVQMHISKGTQDDKSRVVDLIGNSRNARLEAQKEIEKLLMEVNFCQKRRSYLFNLFFD